MKFQSAYIDHTIVIRPARGVGALDPTTGLPVPPDRGLRAKFLGPQRIFDSVTAQHLYGWSDEERLTVERGILTYEGFDKQKDQGRGGVYLAPGQEIPPEHADLNIVPSAERIQASGGVDAPVPDTAERCVFISTGIDDVEQCPNPAEPGSDLCKTHSVELAQTEGAPVKEPKKKKEPATA